MRLTIPRFTDHSDLPIRAIGVIRVFCCGGEFVAMQLTVKK
jgi:hypothetical protein